MEAKLEELKARLGEISDLRSTASLVRWDQSTYMPPGGARAHGRQFGTLQRVAHQKFVDPEIGRLLEGLRSYEESVPYDSDEASLIRVTRREYDRATRVPAEFMAEYDSHRSAAYQAWSEARPADDFSLAQPYLERTLELSRRYAGYLDPDYEHIADPLFDEREGMTTSALREIFDGLRERLVPLLHKISGQPVPDDWFLYQSFPKAAQLDFGLQVAKRFGYDLERGRQDLSPHPFSTGLSIDDVRITTRVLENDVRSALFGTMHEAGHALYTQGISAELEGTPLGHGATSGVHESQSRLWENLVGRSQGFWSFFFPRLQTVFADQLASVTLDDFYRAINKVQATPIRTAADEVSYNLHCALRFQLELDLLEGRVAVADLPKVWNERFEATLGIVPPSDSDGVLQDMNWFVGRIGGYYQHFTLGNIMKVQFFEAALDEHPEIPSEIEQGEFGTLLGWLRKNIHQHGAKFTIPELVERVTGTSLSIEPFVGYLQDKYGQLYEV